MLCPLAACTAYVAPALALVQNLTPPRSRATAAAVLMLMFNIVGLGLGPLFIGVVSDALKPGHGDESLRWALMTILPFAIAAGLAQFAMTRHLRSEEHTSELQSLMRISYAVFCLKQKQISLTTLNYTHCPNT